MTNKLMLPVFWALVGVFVVNVIVVQVLMGPPVRQLINYSLGVNFVPSLFLVWPLFSLLGLALLILAIKADVHRTLKKFLILTGASAVGFFVSVLLHGAVYGLFVHFFGEDFWERIGPGDEPFFFIMAIFVCPAAYLVGTVGSIVLMIRRRTHETQAR